MAGRKKLSLEEVQKKTSVRMNGQKKNLVKENHFCFVIIQIFVKSKTLNLS